MNRLLATALLLIFTATPAAARQLLEYTIKHPVFGEIGTYSNLIEPTATGGTTVTSRLDVTVKLLGMTAHREHSVRRERWQDGRLIAFSSTTEKNGERYELRGEARGDGFVIQTPRGIQVGPANVLPSNPWSIDMLRSGPLLSTRDGALLTARVSDGPVETITRGGRQERLRRFDIVSDKHDYVWVDAENVPVAFRTVEGGDPVDFVLTRRELGGGNQQASAQPTSDAALR
jgi:hypothetical protein